jgi:hypothetical protein
MSFATSEKWTVHDRHHMHVFADMGFYGVDNYCGKGSLYAQLSDVAGLLSRQRSDDMKRCIAEITLQTDMQGGGLMVHCYSDPDRSSGASGKADASVRRVIDRVVVFQELLANDEVHGRGATVADVRVVAAARDTKVRRLRSRHKVLRRRERERGPADGERERARRLLGELGEAGVGVGLAPGRAQELVVRRRRNVDERGAGVDDGRARAEARARVGDGGDPDAPVRLRGYK